MVVGVGLVVRRCCVLVKRECTNVGVKVCRLQRFYAYSKTKNRTVMLSHWKRS